MKISLKNFNLYKYPITKTKINVYFYKGDFNGETDKKIELMEQEVSEASDGQIKLSEEE